VHPVTRLLLDVADDSAMRRAETGRAETGRAETGRAETGRAETGRTLPTARVAFSVPVDELASVLTQWNEGLGAELVAADI
jgi:hypothetical protein